MIREGVGFLSALSAVAVVYTGPQRAETFIVAIILIVLAWWGSR